MKKAFILILVTLFCFAANAQNNQTKSTKTATTTTIQKAVIQTNGVCEKCEKIFKDNVPSFKGVKDFSYDKNTSKLTVLYDTKKTNAQEIRLQISKLGYNADDIKADPAARAKLPACCQTEKDSNKQSDCNGQHSGCSGNHQGCGGCNGKH